MAQAVASHAAVERRSWRTDAAVVALGAVVLRIPAFVADRHLSYDDGWFGYAAFQMRHGVAPYRGFFAAQGPLHFCFVFVADLFGFRTVNAPRLLPLVCGAALTVATYATGRRVASRTGAIVAAALVATSGSILWVTAGIASDGPALALAVAAVALAFGYAHHPSTGRAVGCGLLVGAALATKGLVVPVLLPIGLLLWSRRRPRDALWAAAGALVVGAAAALPFGVGRVWDQSVVFHRNATRLLSHWESLSKIVHTLLDRDLFVLGAAALALAALFAARRPGERGALRPPDEKLPVYARPPVVLGAWLVAQFALLLAEPELWRPHVAHLITPIALLVALRPPPVALLMATAVVVAPWEFAHDRPMLWPRGYPPWEAAALADLRDLPSGARVISDEPGLLWRAERRSDPYLSDSSIKRIEEGQITAARVARAADESDVCAVQVLTKRYDDLDLGTRLESVGYQVAHRYGRDRVLYTKRDCNP